MNGKKFHKNSSNHMYTIERNREREREREPAISIFQNASRQGLCWSCRLLLILIRFVFSFLRSPYCTFVSVFGAYNVQRDTRQASIDSGETIHPPLVTSPPCKGKSRGYKPCACNAALTCWKFSNSYKVFSIFVWQCSNFPPKAEVPSK